MKICVFGAGAIGGAIAARLAEAGAEVSIVVRGPHLDAIRRNGLTLIDKAGRRRMHLPATDDPAELGKQDAVLVALKAHSMPQAARSMLPLLGRETAVVAAQNGLPWWYFHKEGGRFDGEPLESVDPGAVVWKTIGPERVIGGVIYMGAEVPEPGVIDHSSGYRLVLGEPDGRISERLERISQALEKAGFTVERTLRIRDAIWVKLWGNISFNPLSVLTGARMSELAQDDGSMSVIRTIMEETQAVGERLGVIFDQTVDQRLARARETGPFKTSMLQDFEAARPLELDSVVYAVSELGRRLGVPMPMIDAVHALTLLRARTAGIAL